MAIELRDTIGIASGTALINLFLEALFVFTGVHEFFLQIAPLTYSVTRILVAGMLAVIGIEELIGRDLWSDGSYLYLLGYFTLLSTIVYGIITQFLGLKATIGASGISITFDTFVLALIVASGTLASHYSQMGVKTYLADLKIINYSALLMLIPFVLGELTGIGIFNIIGIITSVVLISLLIIDFASGGRIADKDLNNPLTH